MIELRAWEAALEVLGVRLARGSPRVAYLLAKGGDNVERITKLVKALTELLRVIADIIRLFKS